MKLWPFISTRDDLKTSVCKLQEKQDHRTPTKNPEGTYMCPNMTLKNHNRSSIEIKLKCLFLPKKCQILNSFWPSISRKKTERYFQDCVRRCAQSMRPRIPPILEPVGIQRLPSKTYFIVVI